MSMPASSCCRTMSPTARRTRASNASGSGMRPESSASRVVVRSTARGRLPVCVVRMRSVLRFIVVSPLVYLESSVSQDTLLTLPAPVSDVQADPPPRRCDRYRGPFEMAKAPGGVMLRRRFIADAGELHIDGFQSNIFNSNKCPTKMRRSDWRHAGDLGMLRPRTGPQVDYRCRQEAHQLQ